MAGFLIRQFLSRSPSSSHNKGPTWFSKVQGTLYKTSLFALCVTTLVWTSIFLYAFFYHTYMPPISHTKPVHLQFRACSNQKGICSFPSANVSLTNRESFLMFGQPYRFSVELELPDSASNQQVGMFMICLNLKSRDEFLVGKSCRSALLQYKSSLFSTIRTILVTPLIFLGYTEEKQSISVELFSNYLDDQNYRTTKAYVQIQSRHLEIYSARLQINARFTGIRYIMFNYPYLSATFGFITNLFFLSVIGFLSWYKFYSPTQLTLHVGYDNKTTNGSTHGSISGGSSEDGGDEQSSTGPGGNGRTKGAHYVGGKLVESRSKGSQFRKSISGEDQHQHESTKEDLELPEPSLKPED